MNENKKRIERKKRGGRR